MPNPPVEGYVVSITGHARLRRLHFVGLCHRRPGVHFQEWSAHGKTLPVPSAYDTVCRACWRMQADEVRNLGSAAEGGEDDPSSGSSSSSSSSADDGVSTGHAQA